MSKKTSRRRLIAFSIVIVIGILLSVLKFNIPATDYTFNGFINSIPLGLDLQGGISVVYEASLPADSISDDLGSAIKTTISRLDSLLEEKGYKETAISKQGSNKIRIEVADVTDTEELLSLIGQPVELKFTTENSAKGEALMTGKHVKNAQVRSQDGDGDGVAEYGVLLTFTDEGTRLFADITEDIAKNDKTLYIFVDGKQLTGLKAEGAITSGSTFISGEQMANDYDVSSEFATKILSGSFNTNLKMVENNKVSAVLGENSLLFLTLACCAVLAIMFVLLYCFYGQMGLMACLSILFWACLDLFFLQAVPYVHLSISGFAGLLFSMVLIFASHVLIFEAIKSEYKLGKKIPMSFKSGIKKSRSMIADIHVVSLIASFVLFLAGSATAKSFSIVFIIGALISLLSSLVITKWLLNCYLPFNSTKPKKLRLKREANVNEL